MPMFKICKPVRFNGFLIDLQPLVGIAAPTAAEAISIAKKAGHLAPVLDDNRSWEQRQHDLKRAEEAGDVW